MVERSGDYFWAKPSEVDVALQTLRTKGGVKAFSHPEEPLLKDLIIVFLLTMSTQSPVTVDALRIIRISSGR